MAQTFCRHNLLLPMEKAVFSNWIMQLEGAISLRERSTLVAVLLFINGGLIIAGMMGLAAQDGASESSTLYGTTGLGILLIALGIAKVFITRKK